MCATLVDQWVLDGVTHAMVAPGSRSTPMALALAARRDLRVEVFLDERSAAFAALGAGLVSGRPAIVLCTSGTAATHLHGAVVEAHLAGVPMIVLTADRPPELRDVGAPQTIDQVKLFGDSVRWFHDPGVPVPETAATWRSLARHATDATGGVRPGPVHLNLPFREPLVARPDDLPPPRLGGVGRTTIDVRLGTLSMEIERERGIIVAGRGVDDPSAVASLAAATGWPVLADPRSGCRGVAGAITAFDAILRHDGFAASHVPEVVLHLGEPPASKVLATWLHESSATQVRVHPHEVVIDPAHDIGHRITAPVGAVCERLARELRGATATDWLERWRRAEASAQQAIEGALGDALSEAKVARIVSGVEGDVVVASSMPVRDIEWFGTAAQRARVWANRGANGIDGTIATATGIAAVTGGPVWVLLGDVALVHDSSSLAGLARRALDVRIVVVDNDGGGIFSFLPQATQVDGARFESLFGTPHGTDLVALGAAHGLPATSVATTRDLEEWLGRPGPWLVRVPSDRAQNVVHHRAVNDAVVDAIGRG
jgi:2-succinyl-5-enolpyruvyl-6-hydroxy-3-cyclohexene-1-carboxylate synthase